MISASRLTLFFVLFLAVACGREEAPAEGAEAAPVMQEMRTALEACKNQVRQKAPLLSALLTKLAKGKGVADTDDQLADGSRGMEAGQRGGACLKQLLGNVDKLKSLVQGGLLQNPDAQDMLAKLVHWVFNRKNAAAP